ncbi:hypothetical protein H8356DRAFT_1361495 [Neocallimastix lanati (nom. inval.)]|nr:hypothetical protein H8356DRAFT_1361495 [Neocallimastix sp. JGI-2020a]
MGLTRKLSLDSLYTVSVSSYLSNMKRHSLCATLYDGHLFNDLLSYHRGRNYYINLLTD